MIKNKKGKVKIFRFILLLFLVGLVMRFGYLLLVIIAMGITIWIIKKIAKRKYWRYE